MVCGGVNGALKYVFTASRDGSVLAWRIPVVLGGGRIHHKYCTLKRAGAAAITCLVQSRAHLVSYSCVTQTPQQALLNVYGTVF
jgi:hypothetical protein